MMLKDVKDEKRN